MRKTALVTGASKGIGRALARILLTNGYEVHGTSRSGSIQDFEHPNLSMHPLDLSLESSISSLEQTCITQELAFDLVINNAGIGPDLNTFEPEAHTLRSTLAVNVEGTILFTEKVVSMLKPAGQLINISSKMGSISHCEGTDSIAYRISKSALNMYGQILTNRYRDRLQIATIHPGWVRTDITPDNLHARLSPEESAERIWSFLQSDFKSGTCWDAERGELLLW